MSQDSLPKQWALFYARELDWPVLPIWPIRDGICACPKKNCQEPGKHPIGKLAPNGLYDATKNLETIGRWLNEFPDSNLAIPTGELSGLFVVDIDPDKGGMDSWQKLVKANGQIPQTLEAISGGGGLHIFFKHVPGLRNTTDKLGPGIDTRGEGGYVLVAPSNHLSGGVYRWKS